MLILTRRVGETLMIGEEPITVTIISVKGNQVRIGVHAPQDTPVDREEIWVKKNPGRSWGVGEPPAMYS
jgi:carbon storage regulator